MKDHTSMQIMGYASVVEIRVCDRLGQDESDSLAEDEINRLTKDKGHGLDKEMGDSLSECKGKLL